MRPRRGQGESGPRGALEREIGVGRGKRGLGGKLEEGAGGKEAWGVRQGEMGLGGALEGETEPGARGAGGGGRGGQGEMRPVGGFGGGR